MTLHALNERRAQPVDWWFSYKYPENAQSPSRDSATQRSSGREYLYFDATTPGSLARASGGILDSSSALQKTLGQLKDALPSVGWIAYNDEVPGAQSNDGRKGHSKGVLAFDPLSDSAFWLLHSWPQFPSLDGKVEPSLIYAQTFLCVTLKDVATAERIAEQMRHQQEPLTYHCQIPDSLPSDSPLVRLSQSVDVHEEDPPEDLPFFSREGFPFRLLAKNRHWDKDFWIDWIGPRLGADFRVETWRRGTRPGTEDEDGVHQVQDVLFINLEPLGESEEWHYTKDHAKWGTSTEDQWVVVADINRQTSQEKRGGGAIAFQHPKLWKALSQIERFRK